MKITVDPLEGIIEGEIYSGKKSLSWMNSSKQYCDAFTVH